MEIKEQNSIHAEEPVEKSSEPVEKTYAKIVEQPIEKSSNKSAERIFFFQLPCSIHAEIQLPCSILKELE